MRTKIDRPDDSAPHRLLAAERSSRYDDQVLRLAGLDLTGPLECSNSLIDAVFQQFDDNSLKCIPLECLTSREQEMLGQKKDPELVEYITKIQSGKMIVQEVRNEPTTELTTDLRIKFAWTRRSLAYDQAQLFTFSLLEKWNAKLIARMYESAPPNFCSVSLAQCIAADQKLWMKMSETCRASIQPFTTSGAIVKPLDKALEKWTEHSDLLYLIQPLPMHSGARQTNLFAADRESNSRQIPVMKKKTKGEKKKEAAARSGGKGQPQAAPKAKAKGAGKGKGSSGRSGLTIPEGCCSKTPDGKFICYAYNSHGCTGAVDGESCSKGYHLCGIRNCHDKHPMTACTR